MRGQRAIPALLLLMFTAIACEASARAPAEISTSVILTGFNDMEGSVDGVAPCVWTVNKSKGFGAKKINFVLTLNAKGNMNAFDQYFFKDASGNLLPADLTLVSRFKSGLQKCFSAALDAGFTTIHILPHIDPIDSSTGKGLWRNVVKFDPLARVGPQGAAFTYEDVLLKPAAEALNAVTRSDTGVEFTLTGEQGLSVFSFPRSWAQLLDRTKATAAKGKDASRHSAGVSFNWDKICGCVEPEEKDPIKYNTTYLERFQRFKQSGGLAKLDLEGVRGLLDKSDFIGASGYASTDLDVVPSSHEVSLRTVNFEFLSFGIDLRHYMFEKGKPFYYSEQGLGGCESNGQIAPSLAFVAKHPFWGIWAGQYSTSIDPWQKADYKDYRRRFYSALSKYVQTGGGPTYRVDGVFLWSVGSWDVHGAHPSSYSSQGSFKDDVIIGYIKEANAVAAGLKHPSDSGKAKAVFEVAEDAAAAAASSPPAGGTPTAATAATAGAPEARAAGFKVVAAAAAAVFVAALVA